MKPLQSSFHGEVLIDHRASPGLPEHIARLAGYDPEKCREGKLLEDATLICSHCRARVLKNVDRTRERATCLHCANHYICDWCDAERREPDYVHKPFEAKVEEGLKWLNVSSKVGPSLGHRSPLVLPQQAVAEWESSATPQPLRNTSTS